MDTAPAKTTGEQHCTGKSIIGLTEVKPPEFGYTELKHPSRMSEYQRVTCDDHDTRMYT